MDMDPELRRALEESLRTYQLVCALLSFEHRNRVKQRKSQRNLITLIFKICVKHMGKVISMMSICKQ